MENISKVKDFFDTSNFKEESIYFSNDHKKENGLIKFENSDHLI